VNKQTQNVVFAKINCRGLVIEMK